MRNLIEVLGGRTWGAIAFVRQRSQNRRDRVHGAPNSTAHFESNAHVRNTRLGPAGDAVDRSGLMQSELIGAVSTCTSRPQARWRSSWPDDAWAGNRLSISSPVATAGAAIAVGGRHNCMSSSC